MNELKLRRIYSFITIRKLIKLYYKNGEWGILDIIQRLFTHKFYTNENNNLILVYKTKKDSIYVSILGISPTLYGTGITDKVFNYLTEKNYKYLVGHINVDNTYSINMAKRNGFRVVKVEEKYYKTSDAYRVVKTIH